MAKLTGLGRLALNAVVVAIVAVVSVTVSIAIMRPNRHVIQLQTKSRTIQWELLEAEDGPSLHRCMTPDGWVVVGEDSIAIAIIHDPEHTWLKD